nr:MAG TPA: hypothetical protein [Caudoviricetes sp.]
MPQWVRGGGVSLVMIGFNSLLSLILNGVGFEKVV